MIQIHVFRYRVEAPCFSRGELDFSPAEKSVLQFETGFSPGIPPIHIRVPHISQRSLLGDVGWIQFPSLKGQGFSRAVMY